MNFVTPVKPQISEDMGRGLELIILPKDQRDLIMERYDIKKKKDSFFNTDCRIDGGEKLNVSLGKDRLAEFINIIRPQIYCTYYNWKKSVLNFDSIDRSFEKEFNEFLNKIIKGNMERNPNINMYLMDNLNGYSANPDYLRVLLRQCLIDFMVPKVKEIQEKEL